MNSGYSKTPLAKKLGIKAGYDVWVIGAPKDYMSFFERWPEGTALIDTPKGKVDFIHIFASQSAELQTHLKSAKPRLKDNGMVWVSWPKKTSELPSEIGKFDVMRAGQSIGLVDVKVAAIDEDWSGHKFVYRLKDRKKA